MIGANAVVQKFSSLPPLACQQNFKKTSEPKSRWNHRVLASADAEFHPGKAAAAGHSGFNSSPWWYHGTSL
jgi:hypothetical protein